MNIKTEIANDGKKQSKGNLKTIILNPSGKEVASVITPFTVEPGKTITIDQTTDAITSPQLWTPQTPDLYKAVTTIQEGNKDRKSVV